MGELILKSVLFALDFCVVNDLDQVVTINSDNDRRKTVIDNQFLLYAASYPARTWLGIENKVGMVTNGSVFRFGITIGWFHFTPAEN